VDCPPGAPPGVDCPPGAVEGAPAAVKRRSEGCVPRAPRHRAQRPAACGFGRRKRIRNSTERLITLFG
jgi:hypothetical protein